MVTSHTVYDYNWRQGTLTSLKVQEIPGGYDAGEYVSERLQVTARDGSLLHELCEAQRHASERAGLPVWLRRLTGMPFLRVFPAM